MIAAVVQQIQADILPDRVLTIKLDRVGVLNFHNPKAAYTFNAQRRARNFGQAPLLNRNPRRAIERGVANDRSPPAIVRCGWL